MTDIIHKSASFKQGEDIWYIGSLPSVETPKPGSPGYGAGVYPGDDLEGSLGLFPMEGVDNPNSDNYGNYQNSDGSVFVFIPKFYYSFDCKPTDVHYNDTLKYSGLSEEQLAQIVTRSPMNYMAFASWDAFKNEAEANSHGFVLHRAFIDGGQEKSGFFIMKYLPSKGTDGTSGKALSVKNGKPISLTSLSGWEPSKGMPGCSGYGYDAITLSKAINPNLNCASAFMYSALAMQSKFIGTIVTSTSQCAWYDSSLVANFPKGGNNNLSDINDSSMAYTLSNYLLTGSATPFAKTTHNGLNNGVCDLNGCKWQITTGVLSRGEKILKESSKLSDITTSNAGDINASIYDTNSSPYVPDPYRWGNSSSSSWRKAVNGVSRALEGIYPVSASAGCSTNGTNEFGQDGCSAEPGSLTVLCSGYVDGGTGSGIFRRSSDYFHTPIDSYTYSFRSGGYAN